MFVTKKLKKRIADLETFERGVCKVIEGYFTLYKQDNAKYSMDNAVDKFWHFVKHIDTRLVELNGAYEIKKK